MAEFNISSLIDSLTSSTQQRQQLATQQVSEMQNDTAQLESLLQQNMQATQGYIQDRTMLAGQKAAMEANAAQLRERAQAIVGLNPDDLNNDFVKAVSNYNSAAERSKETGAQLLKAQSVGLLDNPVEWLMNQFALPQLEAQHQAVVSERESAVKDMQARTTMLSLHNSHVVANQADMARQYNLDLAKTDAQGALIKLREEEAKASSAMASRKFSTYQLQDKIHDLAYDQASKQLTLEGQLAAREESKLRFQAYKAESDARMADKSRRDEEIARRNVNLQRFTQLTGLPSMSIEDVEKMSAGPAKAQMLQVAATGMLGANMQDVMKLFVENTAAQSTMMNSNPLLAHTSEKLFKGFEAYTTAPGIAKDELGKERKRSEQVDRAFETYQDELVKSQTQLRFAKPLNSEAWDKVYNPYRAPHASILEMQRTQQTPMFAPGKGDKTAALLNTVFAAKPVGTIELTGEDETTAMKALALQVAKGEIKPAEAALDASNYFYMATKINEDKAQYGVFMLPPQKNYMVTWKGAGLDGRNIDVDLLNPKMLEKAFTEMAVAERQKSFGNRLMNALGATPLGASTIGVTKAVPYVKEFLTGPAADFLRGYPKDADTK